METLQTAYDMAKKNDGAPGTSLMRSVKAVFRQYQSQPVSRVVTQINPILRGWVNYFAVGNSSYRFRMIQRWVELKTRRHLMRARKRRSFGWERWSTRWLYEKLGLFNNYLLRRFESKIFPA